MLSYLFNLKKNHSFHNLNSPFNTFNVSSLSPASLKSLSSLLLNQNSSSSLSSYSPHDLLQQPRNAFPSLLSLSPSSALLQSFPLYLPRGAEVRFYCDREANIPFIRSLNEDYALHYTIDVVTDRLCEHPRYAGGSLHNGQNLWKLNSR